VTTFLDSSALVKRYIDEPDSDYAVSLIDADDVLVSSWLTVVEVRRTVARMLTGSDLSRAKELIAEDFDKIALVSPDAAAWQTAADIAESLGVRSLDSVQLACAQRLRIAGLRFVTFDIRQSVAARALGFNVIGA
jgi:predicted nucleic acid-binding protein